MDFNPRSPHGERHARAIFLSCFSRISIHAPRTGSDVHVICNLHDFLISIHAPRTGSDFRTICSVSYAAVFQSTLPARGATGNRKGKITPKRISIHAPRTGSDSMADLFGDWVPDISIHAPRTGSDSIYADVIPTEDISIHAPRTGSDPCTD